MDAQALREAYDDTPLSKLIAFEWHEWFRIACSMEQPIVP